MDKVLITCVLLVFSAIQVPISALEIDRNLRIVGGTVARVNQFPHAVALVLHLTMSRSSFCGGSIIHANYILTVSFKFMVKNIQGNFFDKLLLVQ